MKKIILKIIVLLAVFIGGVFLFAMLFNQENVESTRDLENPTLPVLCIDHNGYKINRMFGYTQEMDQETLRDGLVPLTTGRTIRVSVDDKSNSISSVTYEVTSLMDGSVLENAKVGNFKGDGDYETAEFTLQEPILMNQEYGLKFTVHMGDEDVFYYTRVVQRASLNTDKYVEFAYNFYEGCMNRENATELNTYLESAETVTNNSYTNIDITSSFNQVTWGSIKPSIYRKAVATIKEINENTGSIVMDYMLSAKDDEGNTELFYVTDFYRMRYFQNRVMLLDFHRNARQIFDGELPVISTKGVELGIAEKTVQFRTNESSTIAAFVQTGELWSYNSSADKLSNIYSMRNLESGDERDDYLNHGIEIIRVEESGDVDFAVYGYMNKDAHEGKVGISVCHYSSERNSVEEKIFIPSGKSYAFLEEDLQKLAYVNRNDHLYLYLDETIYRVNLEEMSYEIVVEQINPECLVVSKDQSRIAWMNEMQEYASSNITLMELEGETSRTITAGQGQKVKAIGFINTEFLYGIAADGDILTDATGNTTFGMNEVRIEAFDGTLVKNYKDESVRVSQVNIKEGLIELVRVVPTGGGYTETTRDNIMNNQPDRADSVEVNTSSNSRKGTVVTLVFPKTITNRNPLRSQGKLKILEEDRVLAFEEREQPQKPLYYVYAKGKLDGVYTKPNEAIVYADTQFGVVLNRRQQYVWERGNNQTENELNNEDIPQAVIAGSMDEKALEEALGGAADVMNLTGCTLEEVLYQLSSDRAVLARRADGTVALIVGYDRYNTLLYDFATGEHTYYGMNDSKALFEGGGNVFISYMEKPTTGGE